MTKHPGERERTTNLWCIPPRETLHEPSYLQATSISRSRIPGRQQALGCTDRTEYKPDRSGCGCWSGLSTKVHVVISLLTICLFAISKQKLDNANNACTSLDRTPSTYQTIATKDSLFHSVPALHCRTDMILSPMTDVRSVHCKAVERLAEDAGRISTASRWDSELAHHQY